MKTEKLAEWEDVFNSWGWPDDFIITKPIDWDSLPLWDREDKTSRTKYVVSKPCMDAIRNIIGEKECLRYHHIHNLKMKNYQFEIWWFVNNVINRFVLKYIDGNFHFDIYSFMNWRYK
jgi:hypothetical protein